MRASPRPCHEARSHELRMYGLSIWLLGLLAPSLRSRYRDHAASSSRSEAKQHLDRGIMAAFGARGYCRMQFSKRAKKRQEALWKAQPGACGTRGIDTAAGTASILHCSSSWKFAWFSSGVVAQMVERSLSMREVRGSIPRDSSQGCGNASSASLEASVV